MKSDFSVDDKMSRFIISLRLMHITLMIYQSMLILDQFNSFSKGDQDDGKTRRGYWNNSDQSDKKNV